MRGEALQGFDEELSARDVGVLGIEEGVSNGDRGHHQANGARDGEVYREGGDGHGGFRRVLPLRRGLGRHRSVQLVGGVEDGERGVCGRGKALERHGIVFTEDEHHSRLLGRHSGASRAANVLA